MKVCSHFLYFTLLGTLVLVACGEPRQSAVSKIERRDPEPAKPSAPAPQPDAPTKIDWPSVNSVLDATDLVDLSNLPGAPMDLNTIAGRYRSEQGGSVLSLNVVRQDEMLRVQRHFQEPGRKSMTKKYDFRTTTPEGAVSTDKDAFMKSTNEGVLLFEKNSGVDSIPASYWVHYARQQ